MRLVPFTLATLVLWAVSARGQSQVAQTPPATPPPAPAMDVEAEKAWTVSASVYGYFVPDDDDYAQPTVTFDRDWFHAEARYNYEDLDTGSAWIGYNIALGEALALEFTPMLGGVFGDTTGIAPGYKGSLSWWKLELYSEGEYLFDTEESSDSFFYNWSELTLAPLDWLRFGLVTQRTRAYDSDRDIQRGLLAGVSLRHLALTAHVLNPEEGDPILVMSAALTY